MKRMLQMFVIIILALSFMACDLTTYALEASLNPGIDTVEINSSFTDSGVTASYGKQKPKVVVETNTVDVTKVGTYQLIYLVTYQSRSLRITRVVTVIDSIPPVVTLLPGIDTVRVGGSWVDAGVDTHDNSNGLISVVVSGTVNTQLLGKYQITYTVTDPSNNQTVLIRFVSVIE